MVGTVLMPSLAALTNTVMLLLFINTDDTKVTFVAWMDLRYGVVMFCWRCYVAAQSGNTMPSAAGSPSGLRLSNKPTDAVEFVKLFTKTLHSSNIMGYVTK